MTKSEKQLKSLIKKQKQTEEKLKSVREAVKKLQVSNKKKQTKEQNKKDILYAIFRRTIYVTDYEQDVKSPEFDKFLIRDYERALFGLNPLKPKEKTEGQTSTLDIEK